MDGKDSGLRLNSGKPRIDLVPMDAVLAVADHYGKGASKYPARNWEKGLKWNEGCMASLLRHVEKWQAGEEYEIEKLPSGEEIVFRHDEAILWNALAIVAFRLRGIGTDDRPKYRVDTEKAPEQGAFFNSVEFGIRWIERQHLEDSTPLYEPYYRHYQI